jgi:hypothetical protein
MDSAQTLAPATPGTPRRTGGQIATIVVGGLVTLAGLGVGSVGGILLGVFGGDGTVASGSQPLSTARTALVSSVADIDDVADVADVVGDPRLRVSASGSDLFLGIGPAADVDRYLSSAPIDEVTDFEVDPFELTRRPRGGTSRPAPPAGQNFWVAEASGGNTATLDWKISDGEYRLVLMKADGSRPVDADGEVKLTLPHVATIAWTMLGVGLLLLVGGVAAMVLALRRRP